jgi:hypothetical protein
MINVPHKVWRQGVKQRNFIQCIANQDPGGMQPRSRRGLAIQYRDACAALRQSSGRGQAGKACTNDYCIIVTIHHVIRH